MEYNCKIDCCEKSGKRAFKCDLIFRVKDSFQDPLSRGKGGAEDELFGAKPYDIYGAWMEFYGN